MKKILTPALFTLLFLLLPSLIKAQTYYVYDTTNFSVIFTCDNDNSKVVNVNTVEYSENSKWVKYTIIDKKDLETMEGNGFILYCKNAKGEYISILYNRRLEKLTIDVCTPDFRVTGNTITLKRRVENKG